MNFGNDRNNDAGLYNSGWNRIIKTEHIRLKSECDKQQNFNTNNHYEKLSNRIQQDTRTIEMN